MKKGDVFTVDDKDYCCLRDGISLDNDKVSWRGQKPIKPVTAIKKKAIEKQGDSRQTDLGLSPELADNLDAVTQDTACVREPRADMSKSDRWFLQTNEMNFPSYFSRGILTPPSWEQKGSSNATREHDLQSYQPESLVLTQRIFSRPQFGTVALEIELTDKEKKSAQGEFICINGSLPISRVEKIHFSRTAGMPEHIHGRYVYPDVLIPKEIITAELEQLPTVTPKEEDALLERIKKCVNVPGKDYAECQTNYDRLLGSLAFTRTAGYFFTQTERMFWEYPNSIVAVLNLLNIKIDARASSSLSGENAKIMDYIITGKGRVHPLLAALRDEIYSGKTLDKTTAREIATRCFDKKKTPEQATDALRQLFKDDDYKGCMRTLNHAEIPGMLPYKALAYLYKFHKKESNDPVNAFAWVGKDLTDDAAASCVLGLLGAYYGYSRIHAFVDVDEIDSDIEKALGSNRLPVKFGARTRLESSLVEHVHAFAFSSYKVCDKVLDRDVERKAVRLPGGIEDLSYDLAGTSLAIYQKVEQIDVVNELLKDTYPPRICQHEFVVATCFAQLWPDLGEYPLLGPYLLKDVCSRLESLTENQLDKLKRHIEFDRKETLNA